LLRNGFITLLHIKNTKLLQLFIEIKKHQKEKDRK